MSDVPSRQDFHHPSPRYSPPSSTRRWPTRISSGSSPGGSMGRSTLGTPGIFQGKWVTLSSHDWKIPYFSIIIATGKWLLNLMGKWDNGKITT